MTDQHRKSALGSYGNELIETPWLDSLASQGAQFDDCYVQSPVCAPSRATIFTGLYPHNHGLWANGVSLPSQHELITKRLSSAGYVCGMVGKQHLSACYGGRTEARHDDGYSYFEWAHDPIHDSPDNAYHRWLREEHPRQWKALTEDERWQGSSEAGDSAKGALPFDTLPPELHYSHWVSEKAIGFIESQGTDRPFMLVANFFDPHHPFGAPDEYVNRYDPSAMPDPIGIDRRDDKPDFLELASRQSYAGTAPGFEDYSEHELKSTIAAYYAMVSLVDAEVGRILTTLERSGLADDTLVIFTSDHGEMLGDHRVMLKGPMQYEAAVNVPLIMRWPARIPAGTRTGHLVQSIDIPATIMQAAGLSGQRWRQGTSLLDLAGGGDQAVRDWALCQYRNSGHPYDVPVYTTMVRYENHKLILWHGQPSTGRPDQGELYDLDMDPDELNNLYNDPVHADLRHRMMTKLVDVLVTTEGRSQPREADW